MSRDPSAALLTEIARRISREEVSDLPIRRYEGPVRLVAAPSDLQRAVQDICQESVVGFDTETRPAFRAGESYLPSLVQFATADVVYLFQVQQQDYSAAMREIFSSDRIIKAGVSVSDDLRNLKKLFEFEETEVVDLGKVAKRHGLSRRACAISPESFLAPESPRAQRRRTGLRAA